MCVWYADVCSNYVTTLCFNMTRYVHNMLEKNATLKFGPSVNNSGARISTSYTSLVATGAHSGYVVYSRLLPSPSVAFALRFALD